MVDKRSIAKQVFDILEDAHEPMSLREISLVIGNDMKTSEVRAHLNYCIKKGLISITSKKDKFSMRGEVKAFKAIVV